MIRLLLSIVIVAILITVVILPFMEKIRKHANKTVKKIDHALTSDVNEEMEKEK